MEFIFLQFQWREVQNQGHGWVLVKTLFQAYRWPLLTWSVLSACLWTERSLFLPFLIKSSVLLDQNPTFMTLFNLNYLLKAPSTNIIILRIRASMQEFGGRGVTVQSKAPSLVKTTQGVGSAEVSPIYLLLVNSKSLFLAPKSQILPYGVLQPTKPCNSLNLLHRVPQVIKLE